MLKTHVYPDGRISVFLPTTLKLTPCWRRISVVDGMPEEQWELCLAPSTWAEIDTAVKAIKSPIAKE